MRPFVRLGGRDPAVGWYEYRGARFRVERSAFWPDRYYVGDVQLPWMRGSMIGLSHEAGWFGWSAASVLRKVRRAVNREFRHRERNGEPVDTEAWRRKLPDWLEPLPEPEREYVVLS